ncbi:MAG: YicC family protein [Clostridia bacterium]|nr:YicC family protein [Clostridia bacterium]
MIKSMTGFGRGEYTDEKRSVTCEIRSVNHRFCEINVKMPRRYQFAEEKLKARIKEKISRGKIELSVVCDDLSMDTQNIRLNVDAAQAYFDSLNQLKQQIPGIVGEIDIHFIANMPEVLKVVPEAEDEDAILASLLSALDGALVNYDKMRTAEGERLGEDILARGKLIEDTVSIVEQRAPQLEKEYADKIRARINELLEGVTEVPEDRIMLEAAVFADKANITEEIVRLKSHCAQLRSIIEKGGPVGKNLDFLVQEMNREVNTIGSKANDISITDKVLILKAEIEKIREQVQNLE